MQDLDALLGMPNLLATGAAAQEADDRRVALLEVDHKSRAHSVLGASSSKRWMECPGSVALTQNLPDDESEDARLGTAAHELANLCLEQGQDAIEYVGRKVHDHWVDDPMAEAVQVYLDECRLYMGNGWTFWIESRFSLAEFNPPVPMFGTGDFVAHHAGQRLIVVVDYKHGVGVNVRIKDNPQLRYYALGAVVTMPAGVPIDRVRMTIVQPRVAHGPKIKSDEIAIFELVDWTGELMLAAARTQEADAPLRAGSWCRESFCKARGRCPEQANAALRAAQLEFADIELLEPDLVITQEAFFAAQQAGRVPALPRVEMLTGEQIAAALRFRDILEGFLKSLDEAASNLIHSGYEVPGWKLVDKRATQSWIPEPERVIQWLTGPGGLTLDQATHAKPLTPAQARTAMTAQLRQLGFKAKDAESMAREMLKDKISSFSSGTKLVPVEDDRDPAAIPGSEFDLLDAPTTP